MAWPTVFIYQLTYLLTVSLYFILRGRFGKLNAWWSGIRHGLSLLLVMLLVLSGLKAQVVSLDNLQVEEDVRRAQLMGKLESDLSFNVRPVQPRKIGDWDSILPMAGKKPLLGRGLKFLGKFGYLDFTPLQLTTQYAANSPFKGNDGPMIPATGLQSMLSGGFFLKLGPLTIQAKPQVVYAQNTPFGGFPQEHDISSWQAYLYAMSFADIPERFGESVYQKTYFGNTSLRLNVGPISAGISNENIWWGPTMMNALLLSSHAPGFKHATINTRRPMKTVIGNFEFQIISGLLDSSGYKLTSKLKLGESLTIEPKKPEQRYINAGVISFQPKFMNNLSFGITRSVQEYTSWLEENGKWFLLLNNITREKDTSYNTEINKDQQASFFGRWLMKKANAELYFEWGRNDAFYAKRDLLLQPGHSRAFTIGFRKIFPKKKKYNFEVFSEMTKQKQSTTRIIRDSNPDWYMHGMVTHGMTNIGEVLGAYVGPGSDFQVIRVSRFNDKTQLAIQLERTAQFTDIYERIFGQNAPNVSRWVDYMLRIQGQYRWKNMIFNAQLAMKYSYNYYWFQKTDIETRGMNYTGDLPAAMLQTGILWRL